MMKFITHTHTYIHTHIHTQSHTHYTLLQDYHTWRLNLLFNEEIILETLCFDFDIQLPHPIALHLVQTYFNNKNNNNGMMKKGKLQDGEGKGGREGGREDVSANRSSHVIYFSHAHTLPHALSYLSLSLCCRIQKIAVSCLQLLQ